MKIEKILVLGAGVMGNGIAQVAAEAGYQVNVYDIKQEFVDNGISIIEKNLNRGLKRGKISEDELKTVLSRIHGFVDLNEAAVGVEFVIEAIIENIEVKIDTYKKLDELLKPGVIIASNTSTISISLLAGGRSNFIGMHFFNPVPMMKLCEIIRGLDTSDEVLEITKTLAISMKKEVIIAKDAPGFIINRILLPMLNEAVFALQEGVGTVEDIDKGIKLGLGHPMGPFTLLDLIGLDTALHVTEAFYTAFEDSKYRVPYLLRQMVASGKLGRKSGEGFYKY
jgi:3-hydroxybutyryl-CoA dehydrogenase